MFKFSTRIGGSHGVSSQSNRANLKHCLRYSELAVCRLCKDEDYRTLTITADDSTVLMLWMLQGMNNRYQTKNEEREKTRLASNVG